MFTQGLHTIEHDLAGEIIVRHCRGPSDGKAAGVCGNQRHDSCEQWIGVGKKQGNRDDLGGAGLLQFLGRTGEVCGIFAFYAGIVSPDQRQRGRIGFLKLVRQRSDLLIAEKASVGSNHEIADFRGGGVGRGPMCTEQHHCCDDQYRLLEHGGVSFLHRSSL